MLFRSSFLHEEFSMLRRNAVTFVAMGVAVLGVVSSISPQFFNILDYATAKIMLPMGGLFISLFIGWHLDKKITFAQLTNDGTLSVSVRFLQLYIFILRYVAPAAIVGIFVYGIFF